MDHKAADNVKSKAGHRPTSEGTRIEYHGSTDRWGRCQFSLHWMADYHPGDPAGEYRRAERGQHFNADPRQYGFPRPEDA